MIRRTRSTTAQNDERSPRSLDARALREVTGGTTYQKIEWTWTDGGITASDDWEARV